MLDLLLFLCLVRTLHPPMWGGNHRWRLSFVVCLVTAALLGASPFTGSAHAARWSFRERRVHLARGLTLLEIRNRRGPVRAKALVVDPDSRFSMGVALARKRFPGSARVSVMARRHRAVAAVNGDFFVPRR